MAGIAFDLRVCAAQRKLRGPVVVEMNRAPLDLVMAALAVGAISAGVHVLDPMGVDTRGAEVLVAFADMAGIADDGAMSAHEPKPGFVVIERFDATPRCLAMAALACLAKTAPVRINGLVTVEAASRRVAQLYALQVAASTLHDLVCVLEHEICERMIEGLAIELDDVGAAPLVVGMTMVAIEVSRLRLTAMEAATQQAVRRGIFVTSQAAPRLRGARKRLVAVVALRLELGVPGDERPGRNKLLEQILRSHDGNGGARENEGESERTREPWTQLWKAAQNKCAA